MEEVAGDAAVDGAAPCQLGPSAGSTVRSNQEENAAISVGMEVVRKTRGTSVQLLGGGGQGG